MVFIIVIVAIIIVFIVLGTLIEGDPSDSKTVKYERPKTKSLFKNKSEFGDVGLEQVSS